MVWGYMSWKGVGELTKIKGQMTSECYQNILYDNMSMSFVKFGKRWSGCSNMIMTQNTPANQNSNSSMITPSQYLA